MKRPGGILKKLEDVNEKVSFTLFKFSEKRPAKVALGVMAVGLFSLGVVGKAFAWSNPSSGSFAYDLWDLAINKIAKGPIGMLISAGFIGGAIKSATSGSLLGSVICTLGAGAVYKLDSIVTSLGYTI